MKNIITLATAILATWETKTQLASWCGYCNKWIFIDKTVVSNKEDGYGGLYPCTNDDPTINPTCGGDYKIRVIDVTNTELSKDMKRKNPKGPVGLYIPKPPKMPKK